jgi:hypothetical protein
MLLFRENYGGVTEKFLYQLRVNALAQEHGGAGVAEVVEAYVGQVNSAEEWIEGSPDKVLGVDRPSLW